MRIAQVAPLIESVPPRFYGGTERIVSYLTEALVRRGHHVTLFASGESMTQAQLVPVCPKSLRLDSSHADPLPYYTLLLEKLWQRAGDFDIIHNHVDYLAYPMIRRIRAAVITTLHGRLDLPGLDALYREFSDIALVSISDDQRKPLPDVNWVATVHHGLPLDQYALHPHTGGYLAFLGRMSPEKGVDRAIEIARRAGMPLRIAAKIDPSERHYYEEEIKPLLSDPLVTFIGEIKDADKNEFLGNAHAFLFPVDWPEPFGIALIEAMACGTPVIAFNRGAVGELMVDGVTGFLVDTVEEAVAAVPKIVQLDRVRVRSVFEERFDAERMAEDYLSIYRSRLMWQGIQYGSEDTAYGADGRKSAL
ncbi:MAG: glycosyl transferase [Desulfatitalea sp. BRH_c12]|nr:MAG: glycosyl transferase [Desulfatitalea sp. BRH_c12]